MININLIFSRFLCASVSSYFFFFHQKNTFVQNIAHKDTVITSAVAMKTYKENFKLPDFTWMRVTVGVLCSFCF